jgi:hypothetical protein
VAEPGWAAKNPLGALAAHHRERLELRGRKRSLSWAWAVGRSVYPAAWVLQDNS